MASEQATDISAELTLDANAVAGELRELFGAEMTVDEAECGGCGRVHAIGQLLAFTHAPGIILRCPSCESVMVRIVRTPRGTYLDVRGAAYMRMPPL